jgi:hypothetical protein
MQNIPPFEESFWFIRVNEVEEYKYPEIKMVFKEFDDKEFDLLKNNLKNGEDKESETIDLTQIDQIYSYLMKIASDGKSNGFDDLAKAYNKLFKRELPNSLKRCFISYQDIYHHLEEIRSNEAVIRVNFKEFFYWLEEYIDLFINLELMNDLSPSKRQRHKSEIDTEIRTYKAIRSKYQAADDNINLFQYTKYKTFNYYFQKKEKVKPDIVIDLMSDLFSGKINRIDNFYLPAMVKQIWFKEETNYRDLFIIIIPLIKLIKSIDSFSTAELYSDEVAYKSSSISEKFSGFGEYCYVTINRLVKTSHPYHPLLHNQQPTD